MARHKLMALTNAVPGKEKEFDTWYARHIHDVLAWPGVLSAQKLSVKVAGDAHKWTTMAIYDIETDDPTKFQADMGAAVGTDAIPITDTCDLGTITLMILTPATEQFWKDKADAARSSSKGPHMNEANHTAATAATREVVDRIVEGMHKSDFQPLLEALDDNVTYWVIGTTKFSGTFHTKKSFIEESVIPSTADKVGPFTGRISDVIVDGNKAAMLMTGHMMRKDGRAYENTYCMVYTVENGKIVDAREYCDTDLVARLHP
jgi:ketosteroid isomerase-like protein